MATKQSLLAFCFAFIAITSNGVAVVCASINATISVSIIDSHVENLNFTKAVIHSGDFFFNVSSQASFFIIQAHSLNASLNLSNRQAFEDKSTAVGLSVGLVQVVNSTTGVYTFHLNGENATNVLVSVQGYDGKAPIPGGCNMVLDPREVPYQVLRITNEMIEVVVQPASEPGKLCEDAHVKLEMYHYFFGTGYNDEAGYFNGVEKMMTVDGIMKFGVKVGESTSVSHLSRFYNNYKGIGVVFAVIARYVNTSSAYVPAATFGCNRLPGETTCKAYYYPAIPLILYLVGILAAVCNKSVTLGGNLVVLAIVTLYTIAQQISVDPLYIALPAVVIFAVVLYVCRRFNMDRQMNAFMAGNLLATYIVFSYLSDTDSFKNDVNYWAMMHAVIVFALAFSFFPFKRITCIFTACIYLAIGASIHYNGVFYYYYLDEYRRWFVKNFNLATIDPPSTSADSAAITFAVLMCVGVHNCLCCCLKRNTSDETTPLLA